VLTTAGNKKPFPKLYTAYIKICIKKGGEI